MSQQEKLELNFHDFLKMMRVARKVTLEQLAEGICSVSMMKRIENGERLPDKLTQNRILSRMGVALEGYEEFLAIDEYEEWELRQDIVRKIRENEVSAAEELLQKYKSVKERNIVELQFYETMNYMLLKKKKEKNEILKTVIERAVYLTMPGVRLGYKDKYLFSVQEVNLLLEYIRYQDFQIEGKDNTGKVKHYLDLIRYIESSFMDKMSRAKVYPKAVYFLCEVILQSAKNKENLILGIQYCNQAIELLRDTRKMFYLVELLEMWQKLTREKQFLVRAGGMREEADKLLEEIQEQKKVEVLLKNLYSEYQMTPYIEDFCYLYVESRVYCIKDVVRIRRKMLHLSQKELAKGICSEKTLSRLEKEGTKTHMSIVRALFERLGLCAEYIRGRVITNDYEVLVLAENVVRYEHIGKLAEWEASLKKLEQALSLDVVQNRQFIEFNYVLLALTKREISKKEFIRRMEEIIEYTIPLEKALKVGEKYLTHEEIVFIHDAGMQVEIGESNPYLLVSEELCREYEANHLVDVQMSRYEFLVTGLSSYLGNVGKYEMSNQMSTKLTKESLVHKRMGPLALNLYNNLWNSWQMKIHINDKETLEKCIMLGKLVKKENSVAMYEKKLRHLI